MLDAEDRIRSKVPTNHNVFAWLVEHAAWLLTIRTTQSDGITPRKRLKGTNFNMFMVEFGESCLYKLAKKSAGKSLEGKLGANWKDGIFLGYSRDSNEFILWSVPDTGGGLPNCES